MLDCVRPVSVDIWRVERSVYVWSSWHCRPTSSYPQRSRALQYVRLSVCRFHAFGQCFLFPVKCPVLRFLQVIFENFVGLLREAYSLNWCKFIINVLSSMLNGMLHYRYFTSALELLFTIISCFCLQTPEMYLK